MARRIAMRKYVAAWILGVPVSILVVVWAISHVASAR
jgi:hypothetical protein